MSQPSLISRRERRASKIGAVVFVLALVVGAVLLGNRIRMLIVIRDWQDDATVITSSSGTISVRGLGCPLALGEDEAARITVKVANDWTREVGIEVTFHTEDLANDPPYAYITSDPLCEPVLVDVAPGKTANVTCELEQKTVSQGAMMPLAVKARTVAFGFGPYDYDSVACPIWIVEGTNGNLVVTLLALFSLIGMLMGAAVWGFLGYLPNEPIPMLAVALLWLAGIIVAGGTIIFAVHEVVGCMFLAGLVILGGVWVATRDRRRKPIRSIFE